MGAYAIKTDKPFIATKPLIGKKTSPEHRAMVHFFDTHDFHVQIIDSEPVVKVTDKTL